MFVVILVACIVFTAGMHVALGVPYVPTPRFIAEEMIRVAQVRDGETVMDLGAGDGRVLIAAKKMYPGIRAIGCEFVPAIWLFGLLYIWWSRTDVRLRLGSAQAQDIHDADVVLLYLMPALIASLSPKFDRELKPGARVVSRAFRIPGRQETSRHVLQVGKKNVTLYLYRW